MAADNSIVQYGSSTVSSGTLVVLHPRPAVWITMAKSIPNYVVVVEFVDERVCMY